MLRLPAIPTISHLFGSHIFRRTPRGVDFRLTLGTTEQPRLPVLLSLGKPYDKLTHLWEATIHSHYDEQPIACITRGELLASSMERYSRLYV